MLCSNVGQTWYISLKVLEASRSGASRASLWCCSAWDETWSIHQLNIFIWNWNKISSKAAPRCPSNWLNWPGTCAHPAAPLEAIWGQWPEKVGSRQRKVSMFQTIHCVQSWFQTCLVLVSFNEHVIIMIMITTWWWGVTFPVVLPVLLVAPNRGSFCSAFGRENGNWKNTHWSNCRTW